MFANEKEKWIEYQKQEMRETWNMTHHHSILQREKYVEEQMHRESYFSFPVRL